MNMNKETITHPSYEEIFDKALSLVDAANFVIENANNPEKEPECIQITTALAMAMAIVHPAVNAAASVILEKSKKPVPTAEDFIRPDAEKS